MLNRTAHPEDVKAAIRKKYGSIKRFCESNDLPKTGVSDLFRGRKSQRVSDAIDTVLAQSTELDSASTKTRRLAKAGGAK